MAAFLVGAVTALSIGVPLVLALKELDLYNWLQLVLIAIAAVITLKSVRAARDAADQTRKAVQAQILSGLLDEYGSTEMQQAIDTLRTWFSEQGDHLADELRKLKDKQIRMPDDLYEARRKVSHYFQKVTTLWLRADLLEKTIAAAALDKGQVEIYRELIEPLEWTITTSYNRTSFDFLGKEYKVRRRTIPGLEGWESEA